MRGSAVGRGALWEYKGKSPGGGKSEEQRSREVCVSGPSSSGALAQVEWASLHQDLPVTVPDNSSGFIPGRNSQGGSHTHSEHARKTSFLAEKQ